MSRDVVSQATGSRLIAPIRRHVAPWVASLLLLSACTATQPITDAVDAGQLEDLQSIDQLATAFNEDAGQPRLILLLSPT